MTQQGNELIKVDKLKVFARSQFKIIYELDNSMLVSVRIDGNKDLTLQELNALQLIKKQDLKTSNSEYVMCLQKGQVVPGIKMEKINGTSLDLNKITNVPLLLDAIILTLQGKQVSILETGVIRVTEEKSEGKERQTDLQTLNKALQTVCMGLVAIFEAKEKAAINDLQIIVSFDGSLTIIDPTYAAPFQDFKGKQDEALVEETYKRLFQLIKNLVSKGMEISKKLVGK